MPPGQQAQKPVGAAGGVLVDVGVPTGGERQVQVMRKAGAEHAHFAGAGDVNQVGTKALEHFADEGNVAQKRGVEAEIFFESEGEKAAGQFEGPDVAVFDDGLGAIAGAHAEEREDCGGGRRPQNGGWCGRRR